LTGEEGRRGYFKNNQTNIAHHIKTQYILYSMKTENTLDHKRFIASITTTPTLKRLSLLVSERTGTCKRNSVKTGVGKSISHGYNAALLIAAKYYGLADITKIDKWYSQYKSKT
jgi:hypothetical protein